MEENRAVVNLRFGHEFLGQKLHLNKSTSVEELRRITKEFYRQLKDFDEELINFLCEGALVTNDLSGLQQNEEGEIVIDVDIQSPIMAAPTGRCSGNLVGHSEAVLACQFRPDGLILASGGGDGTVRFWDTLTKTPLRNLPAHRHWIQSLGWSAAGKWLAAGAMNGEVCLIRLEDMSVHRLKNSNKSCVTSIAWSKADEWKVCFGTSDGKIYVYDSRNLAMTMLLSGHDKDVTSLKFHGKELLSSSRDCHVKIWNEDGTLKSKIKAHGHWVNYLDISGEKAFSASDDNTVGIIDLTSNQLLKRLVGHQGPVAQVLVSPDGKLVASCSFDKSIKIWNATDGEYMGTLRGHVGAVYRICWSRNSKHLSSISKDSTLKIWDTLNFKLIRELSGHKDEIYCIDWSSKGVLASGGKDRTLRLWD